MRSTTYIRPLMIPIPLAPKQANVQEEERVSEEGCLCFHLQRHPHDQPFPRTMMLMPCLFRRCLSVKLAALCSRRR